jgi:hypothetical protein
MENFFAWFGKVLEKLMSHCVPNEAVLPVVLTTESTPQAPIMTVESTSVPSAMIPTLNGYETPKEAWHSVRVMCDSMGLSVYEKNVICACIFQESQFSNNAVGRNKDKIGRILSTDWGIVQINDYWHVGKGKTWPSVEYIKDNPGECVKWMIDMYMKGNLNIWTSYKSGAYRKWLEEGSPMWDLRNNN